MNDMHSTASYPSGIAVVGMGCWYPGANSLQQLWENILARRQQFRQTPDRRLPLSDYYDPDPTVPDKTYGNRMAVIDGFEFDWVNRRIPKTVVDSADIAQWLALEVAIQAAEDAGYTRTNIPTERTGVLLGNTLTGEFSRSTNLRMRWPYVRRALVASATTKGLPSPIIDSLVESMEVYYKSVIYPITEDTLPGNLSNTIAGRICNFFNFHGGGYTVDGACSSSLIAVAQAANALMNGDLDLAFAGGVDISLDTFELIGFAKTGALTSKDMTVYDRRASGFIPGEGCGFVILKRLEDAHADGNYVYAVLRGWGISSDGKGGITAPSSKGQSIALRRAYERAGYSLHTLDFIEGHGTGTVVGDKTELEGIALAISAYGEAVPRSCGITSFKSLVGHTKAAAGVGAFIKSVMAVNRRVIPPVADCKQPNTVFESSARCLYPILQGKVRNSNETLRAGVSAMGFGGINCHVTIESGDSPADRLQPSIEERSLLVSNQDTEIFLLSAASISELLKQTQTLITIAEGLSIAEMVDLAAYLGRELKPQLPLRAAVIANQSTDLIDKLTLLEKLLRETRLNKGEVVTSSQNEVWVANAVQQNRIGFLFPGQGSQKLNMTRTLIERYSWARELLEQAKVWLQEVASQDVQDFMYVPLDRAVDQKQVEEWSRDLAQTEVAQPAICLASLLWTRYLERLGVKPTVVGGHSLGELSAFYQAGAFNEKTFICLAAIRGKAMSASVEGEGGAMASLACSQEVAENILKQVSGYVVLANLNSPEQTVISGEEASVEQAIELAKKQGIQVRPLPVSNGFHSQLVSAAAEHLRQHELILETLEKTTVPLFSSINGQQLKQGLQLREHLANQIISQVDFVSLVKNLRQNCDLLVEVGPGKVLSSLVNEINGSNGIPCFPIESKPGLTQDLNVMLAALFVRGAEIKWGVLYENRLVRPFVPASQRVFIENPIELPFQVSPEHLSPDPKMSEIFRYPTPTTQNQAPSYPTPTTQNQAPSYPTPTTQNQAPSYPTPTTQNQAPSYPTPILQDQVPWDVLSNYIAQRARFLTELIRADLQTPPYFSAQINNHTTTNGHASTDANGLTNGHAQINDRNLAHGITNLTNGSTPANHLEKAQLPLVQTHTIPASNNQAVNIEAFLVDFIAKQTGFPKESITPETRLLDDLNLDSIKAGELIAATTQEFDVAGKIDPVSMANATIQEIADSIRVVMPAGSKTTIDNEAATATSNRVNASQNEFVAGARTDVNANSGTELPTQTRASEDKVRVRDYIIQSIPEESTPVFFHKHPEENWQTADVLILCESADLILAKVLCDQIQRQGAQIQALSFDEALAQALIDNRNFTHYIALLPFTPISEPSINARILRMIERLRCVATVPPASEASRTHTTVAYVLFSGGHFGTQPPFADVDQSCAIGFASSLHLERPDLKVRVVDFSPTLSPMKMSECVIQELSTAHLYLAAGYDANLTRYVPRPQVQEPVEYEPRAIEWSSDDVILAIGGGKGITAECALALAKETGVRTAIVGRSSILDKDSASGASTEIIRTFDHFNAEGLTCRCYSCDVSDPDSLASVLRQIRQDMGEITGIIHGAALNWPKLINQSSVQEAFEEVKPKLKGVLNLCQAFENTPLKLFAGFSSVIGVTGMQRNAWYGFSNEALDLVLRRFKTQHPQTAVVTMAYSVWEEVGMGARMGSVRTLAKMGIKAIPKDVGAARFVHLIKNEPADLRVVIAAPMQALSAFESGGFDTWFPKRCAPPEDLKFLEHVVLWEEGVEILARTHLSLERDSYLLDHLYKGSYLFPTVFGLEAMAQAVSYVTGERNFSAIRIEDIRLERPIVVDPNKGLDIEIHAEVLEREFRNAPQRVFVSIKTEKTGFTISHFSATFVLGEKNTPVIESVELPTTPLDIRPKEDLYNWLLFQGPRFQRLQQILTLDSQKCVFQTQRNFSFPSPQQEDLDRANGPFLLGDPYYRDTLLQAGQLVIPQYNCLPVRIDCIEIYQPQGDVGDSCVCIAVPQGWEGKQFHSKVLALTKDAQVVEKLSGYQVQLLEHHKDNPTVEELVAPQERDEVLLRQEIHERTRSLKVAAPEIALAYLPGLGALPPTERHEQEVPLFHRAIGQLLNSDAKPVPKTQINWKASGKPVVDVVAEERFEVSLSHDERICICVAGRGDQGCDIEPITYRTQEDWNALISDSRQFLMEQLLDANDAKDRAGTRIWTAVEALQKAIDSVDIKIEIDYIAGDSVLFRDAAPDSQLKVLTFPVRFTRGVERMVALVVHDIQPTQPITYSLLKKDLKLSEPKVTP